MLVEYPHERITPNRTSCREHESQNAPNALRVEYSGDLDAETAYGTRAGGAGVSSAPAGTHESGAHHGGETARKYGRRLEISANQLRLRTIIGIFTYIRV